MITLTIDEAVALGAVLISVGGLVVYIKLNREATARSFERIEVIERILIAEGLMEVEGGTQTGHDGRGVRRPRGLKVPD